MTRAQLRRRGMAAESIRRAVASGRLHTVHPGVYSMIPPTLMSAEAWHAAAILLGGRDACLCSHSAAFWMGLVRTSPALIHVAVTGDRTHVEGVRWHKLGLRADERVKHNGMPITVPERIPLDLAANLPLWELKSVLAELEFHYGIGPQALTTRRGYAGSRKLRVAIADHTPELAATREGLEQRFVAFLVERGFALPRFNHPVGRSTVDALYEEEGVVIELDGVQGHSGERRVLRDHRRDLHRRADGLIPLRYHYTQLTNPADQALVEAELDRVGIPRTRR